MKMMPPLNDEPVNAHLLMSSIEMELALKKAAEDSNVNALTLLLCAAAVSDVITMTSATTMDYMHSAIEFLKCFHAGGRSHTGH